MWKILLITACVLLATMESEAAKRKRGAGSGTFSSAGTGGYFGDYDDFGFGYAPDFGFNFIDPYAFHQQLTQQILAQQAAQQNAIAQTFVNGDAAATAGASNLADGEDNDLIYRQQQALFNNIRNQNQFSYGTNGNRYAPNYSVASASLGPNGGYHTTFISPENPNIPNLSSRFGSSSPGGYKGVSVSSFSTSSDVNGKRTSNRGAQTTINDNGRVTTYKVNS